MSNSWSSAGAKSCVDLSPAPRELHLNASVLFSSESFYVPLSAPSGLSLLALLDSGSSHCFIDFDFAKLHNLHLRSIPPIPLRLFDGSLAGNISFSIDLPVTFPSGHTQDLSFYVTKLDSPSTAVLGLNWLTTYNPLVDWSSRTISFPPAVSVSAPVSVPQDLAKSSEQSPTAVPPQPPVESSDSVPPPPNPPSVPSVSLVGAAALARAAKLPGTQVFHLRLRAVSVPDDSASAFDDDDDDLGPPDLSNVPPEYHEFADVFSKKRAYSLPPHRPYDLKIELEGDKPLTPGRLYSLSPAELDALREFIDKNLSAGFIRQSTSPHGAPIVFAKKKDGSLRLCVDFRALNRITKKDHYSLPLISDLLNAPGKAQIYSKIDFRHAYHLVRIAEGDEWKTTFRTRYGSFEWLVIPEGLTNAPAAFQRFMNDIFRDMLDDCVIVYLDDIVVYSNNLEVHRKHVRKVLRRLQHHGLYTKMPKCTFHTNSVEYLGYMLSPSGLRMAEDKVKVILDWPTPRKVKDVQSFWIC